MRRAFTLIELMISISILSMIMLFLYKSYAELNLSNRAYSDKSHELEKFQMIKKVFYLDISLALPQDNNGSIVTISSVDSDIDRVFMQTSHSLHRRINPNVAYIVKDSHLYRIESQSVLKEYPFASDILLDVDYMGDIKRFRLYPSKNKKAYIYDIDFKNRAALFMKVKALNER